jgi:ech hydrogenase subunit F
MSLRNAFKKPATKMYPTVPIKFTSRTKGHVVNDIDDCILCGICEKRCPTHALVVEKQHLDEAGEKTGGSWTIDRFSCIQCLTCVRSCPKKCLTMDPHYAAAATEKFTETTHKPEAISKPDSAE